MRAKVVVATIAAVLTGISIAAVRLSSVDAREIGRSDPKLAANWFNFYETYRNGAVLGVAVNSSKSEAIQAAEKAGLTVMPAGWGDNRAGGASLYDRPTLLATALRQPNLHFANESDTKEGMIVSFHSDRVKSVTVFYINWESI